MSARPKEQTGVIINWMMCWKKYEIDILLFYLTLTKDISTRQMLSHLYQMDISNTNAGSPD